MLTPGGKLRSSPITPMYFAHMQATLAAPLDLTVIPFDSPVTLHEDAPAGSIVGTNFERKYIAEGRTFHATAAIKP